MLKIVWYFGVEFNARLLYQFCKLLQTVTRDDVPTHIAYVVMNNNVISSFGEMGQTYTQYDKIKSDLS